MSLSYFSDPDEQQARRKNRSLKNASAYRRSLSNLISSGEWLADYYSTVFRDDPCAAGLQRELSSLRRYHKAGQAMYPGGDVGERERDEEKAVVTGHPPDDCPLNDIVRCFPVLYERKGAVETRVRTLNEQRFSRSEEERFLELQLRVLLSHLNHPLKLQQLQAFLSERVNETRRMVLHLPAGTLRVEDERKNEQKPGSTMPFSLFPYKELRRNRFGAALESLFKGSTGPCPLAFPGISSGLDRFLARLRSGRPSLIVSGFCPLSFLADDLKSQAGDGTLTFPPTPLLSDAVYVSFAIQCAMSLGHLSGNMPDIVFWFPRGTYADELTYHFQPSIDEGEVRYREIEDGLSLLEKHYERLVVFMRTACPDVNFRVVGDRLLEEPGKELLAAKRAGLDPVEFHYGRYRFRNEREKTRYKDVILMHSHFAEKGFGTLHLENSYELWPNLHAENYLARTEKAAGSRGPSGSFSWFCYPSVPSLTLRQLRDFNAPSTDKIYLVEDMGTIQDKLRRSRPGFLSFVYAALFPAEWRTTMEERTMSRTKKISLFRKGIEGFIHEFQKHGG